VAEFVRLRILSLREGKGEIELPEEEEESEKEEKDQDERQKEEEVEDHHFNNASVMRMNCMRYLPNFFTVLSYILVDWLIGWLGRKGRFQRCFFVFQILTSKPK